MRETSPSVHALIIAHAIAKRNNLALTSCDYYNAERAERFFRVGVRLDSVAEMFQIEGLET